MSDIVSLRQFRKTRARSEKDEAAQQNRILFGRTKAEKELTRARNDKAERSLDQSKLDRSTDEPD